MAGNGAVVVVGGTRAIGFELVRHFLDRGDEVWLTGQSRDSVDQAHEASGGRARRAAFDLADPSSIAPALAEVGSVKHLVLAAIDRDANSVREYDIARAIRLTTLKLVGYTETVHALLDRFDDDSSIVLFGGMAKERPYPGSTTVSTVNGGVVGLTRTLVEELRPIRVNSLHPGIVGDSPFWAEKPDRVEHYRSQTPTGRLATMADIVHATVFLLENRAMNGVDLVVDGGWHCR
jgi:NAD(P)-dependent dehydrogenase (short-subunit alcohol dehydrogenase family)